MSNYILTCWFTFLTAIVFSQTGISVSPGKLYFQGPPGETINRDVIINNPTNEPVDVIFYFRDWKRDSTGKKIYLNPGEFEKSCLPWLTITPQSMHLEPQESRNLRATMTIPEDIINANHVFNTMLFAKQNRAKREKELKEAEVQSMLDVYFQVGVHVYYTPSHLRKKSIELVGFDFPKKDYLRLSLKNNGEIETVASIRLELSNLTTGEEFHILQKPKRVSFLPGDFRYVKLHIPVDLPKGDYSALAIVDYDPNLDLEIGMIDFKIE